MKRIGFLWRCFLPVILFQFAAAEEDLLNILEGDSPKAPAASSSYRSPHRSLFPKLSAEQNIFFQFLDAGEDEKALYQWPEAFESSAFEKSANGQALYSLLLFKNGLQLVALEKLFSVRDPENISSELVKEWTNLLPSKHPIWGVVQVAKWHPQFTKIFGESIEIRVRGRDLFGSDQIEYLKGLLSKTRPESEERSLVIWQMVLALASQDSGEAAKVLAHLMKSQNNPVSMDLMNITAARLLYEKGFLDAAGKYYEKVPKSSEYWFVAQEELGWTHLRKGEPQKALAISKTITIPLFIPLAGPEASFMRSLAQLKVCDYPGVMQTLADFQGSFRPRVKALMDLSQGGYSVGAAQALELLKNRKLRMVDLKGEAKNSPRFLPSDRLLENLARVWSQLESEAKKAGDLYARSLAGGTAKVGFTGHFETLKKNIESRVHESKSIAMNRVKTLAQEEVDEIATILRKMHIVEAEVIQQTALSQRVIDSSDKKMALNKDSGVKVASNQLQFPAKSGKEPELWFDEPANFHFSVSGACQATGKKK